MLYFIISIISVLSFQIDFLLLCIHEIKMNQYMRLKQSDGAGQFCCNKIAAGITALGWPFSVFCEGLADGMQKLISKMEGGLSLWSNWIFILIFRHDTLKEAYEN